MKAEEAYFAGALCDAYLDRKRNEIQLYQKNKEWLVKMNDLLYKIAGKKGKIFERDVFLLRKRDKDMFAKIEQIVSEKPDPMEFFISGLFDSEGSIYLSSKSKIPVVDITQSEKGKHLLDWTQHFLEEKGIPSKLNGPYKHRASKLEMYHLRIYGVKNCKRFFLLSPTLHPEKRKKIQLLLELTVDPKL